MTLHSIRNDAALNAATDFILSVLDGEPASLESMRAVAIKELKRPRTAVHREWCEIFLAHTREYERAKTIAGGR